ncbi:bifunctional helix-turn-helix transcriptional regulator/GNAT family N-acetyltransferase [Caballeronia sp. DA-9]|uniref:bifunctional helix-turn-helix transcriptional regulator/GNAT family N-acetyltransferase n=1 Tax=Caballeronia sp. DA-9 TaxID=3436237 RepID=UPI003F6622C2
MRRDSSEGLRDAVRRFQWFYTQHVWAPHELVEQSALSPTEWRVLFAVMHAGTTIAAELSRTLQINTGYLSRMLNEFERSGLIRRTPFAGDARSHRVSLTLAGESALAATSTRMRNNVSMALESMTPDESSKLVASMEVVEKLLTLPLETPCVRLRGPRPGDFGWIVEREAELATGGPAAKQAREMRAAKVVADFLTAPDPTRNACWIAEKEGVSVGAALLICAPASADARIAIVFVDADAERKGIGHRLLEACEEFAVEAGYERLGCVPDLQHELVEPLLRGCGFQERNETDAVLQKYLK